MVKRTGHPVSNGAITFPDFSVRHFTCTVFQGQFILKLWESIQQRLKRFQGNGVRAYIDFQMIAILIIEGTLESAVKESAFQAACNSRVFIPGKGAIQGRESELASCIGLHFRRAARNNDFPCKHAAVGRIRGLQQIAYIPCTISFLGK